MRRRVTYSVAPRSLLGWAATGLMAAAAAMRLVWWIGWSKGWAEGVWAGQALLPILACALFVLALQRRGEQALWVTWFPVVLGVLFFILKADSFVWWHRLLCTALYLAIAVVYGLAVFGLPVRWLLIAAFGLPLAVHLGMDALGGAQSAAAWLQEGSVLCIMAALLCTALAMRKQKDT